jgi:methyl-accepting chemotaxis protein
MKITHKLNVLLIVVSTVVLGPFGYLEWKERYNQITSGLENTGTLAAQRIASIAKEAIDSQHAESIDHTILTEMNDTALSTVLVTHIINSSPGRVWGYSRSQGGSLSPTQRLVKNDDMIYRHESFAVLSPPSNCEVEVQIDRSAEDRNLEYVAFIIAGRMLMLDVVIFVVIGSAIRLLVIRPLNRVIPLLKDIAEGQGDLTKRLPLANHDEFGQLSLWFNAFIAHLQDIMRTVSTSTDRLAAAASQLGVSSESLHSQADRAADANSTAAESSTKVQEGMGSIVVAVEEMSHSIKEIANRAQESSRIATHAAEVATVAKGTISKLADSSTQIGQVVDLINSIAAQVHLLALNATIEAARAGMAGRGFAVVASEIKSLADQTRDATKEIATRVSAIRNDSQDAAKDIAQIDGVITQVNQVTNAIAAAVEEQSATTLQMNQNIGHAMERTKEINSSITSANDVSHHTTSAAEQVHVSSKDVAANVEELKRLIAKFKF